MTKRELVAQAFWEGGRFPPSESWPALDFNTREILLMRADAALAALAKAGVQ